MPIANCQTKQARRGWHFSIKRKAAASLAASLAAKSLRIEERKKYGPLNRNLALFKSAGYTIPHGRRCALNNPPAPPQVRKKRLPEKWHRTEEELDEIARKKTIAVSVKSIMRDLVELEPALITNALRAGLKADPPRSYPYLALAAAYTDGRPTETINVNQTVQSFSPDSLSRLSNEELEQLRQLHLKMTQPALTGSTSPEPLTIDVTPVRDNNNRAT